MIIGCVKEVKNNEFRVGVIPNTVKAYVKDGHTFLIEKNAGLGSHIPDEEYTQAGARILDSAKEVWEQADMIIKVKEPLEVEYNYMRENQILYTYFHFAANEALTNACLRRKIIALAYETVQETSGQLPLLKPMSEVAGSMAPIVGAYFLMRPFGGYGVLPAGITGTHPAKVLVLGAGTVGRSAAKVAAGMGAEVLVLDINEKILDTVKTTVRGNITTAVCTDESVAQALVEADITIGAVLVPGSKAPKLVRKEHLATMKKGVVIVDVAIDQGGCLETSKPTTHADPVFTVNNVIHYCVANMPGAFARTATFALNSATLSYGLEIASKGVEQACRDNKAIALGLNMYKGIITFKPVAEAFGKKDVYKPFNEIIW
jgi:alanine dehydrogenase